MALDAAVRAQKAAARFERLRARHEWLDHLVRAGERYTERHGNHYAAAITFFSILSLVPLLMVAFAVAGQLLYLRPDLLEQLQAAIGSNLPPGLSDVIDPIIDGAIRSRAAVGVIGLAAALYSGIGWMSNMREALSEQWAQVQRRPTMIKRMAFDLLALLGLGLALAASFAITGLASGFAGSVLSFVGLADQGWARAVVGVLGVLLGLAADWLVFLWVIARLPRERASLRSAARAALLGAVGFEIIKQAMTYYLGAIARTPSGAVFGSTLGLLLFVYIGSRFLLFVTAWAATARDNQREAPAPAPGPAVIRSEVTVHDGLPPAAAAGLLGAGIVTGALGARLLTARRR